MPPRALSALLAPRRPVVLCYHGVGRTSTAEDPHFLRVPPGRFRAQVELLLNADYRFVRVSELGAQIRDGGSLHGLAALSFDDGWEDNHGVVLPILRSYGVPATVFVTTGLIAKPNPWTRDGARMMNVDQLCELVAAGFEIGAHTVSHPDLSRLDQATCLQEMTESRDTLAQIVGQSIDSFAYPYCAYGPAAVAAAQEAGFEVAVTCHGRGSWRQWEVKRAAITGKDGLLSFLLKIHYRYDPLFNSPAGRTVRELTRSTRSHARQLMERRGS